MNNNGISALMSPGIIRPRSRSWTEITAAILYSAQQGAVTKTKIMSKTFLSYEQTVRYLADLGTGDLVEALDQPPRHFRTTDKGCQFLKAYEMVQDLTPANCRIDSRLPINLGAKR